MPRIHSRLFRHARAIDSLLPQLLPVCRVLRSAQNELKWLRQHVMNVLHEASNKRKERLLNHYVLRRARHEPLQYILGSEFFGDLEIKCRPGVLIPRQETAASVSHLVKLISSRMDEANTDVERPQFIRVLDLCTGTGCIPLLFHHKFYSCQSNSTVSLDLVGVDISPSALNLACENQRIQLQQAPASDDDDIDWSPERQKSLQGMKFLEADVLRPESSSTDTSNRTFSPPSLLQALQYLSSKSFPPTFNILISNPPYISPANYKTTISRSVRDYEPKLALVPPQHSPSSPPGDSTTSNSISSPIHPSSNSSSASEDGDGDGDTFYPQLLHLASQISTQIVLFEVADFAQARRVAALTLQDGGWTVEIWRDDPTTRDSGTAVEEVLISGRVVPVRGSGHGRSVYAYKRGS